MVVQDVFRYWNWIFRILLRRRLHQSRLRNQPYPIIYSSGPCMSLSPGARTPTVPSSLPTSARSLVATPATVAIRADQQHRQHCLLFFLCFAIYLSIYLFLSLFLCPKNSRIPLSTWYYQQQEHRDQRLMLPRRSPPHVLLFFARPLFPALLARCTHGISLSLY